MRIVEGARGGEGRVGCVLTLVFHVELAEVSTLDERTAEIVISMGKLCAVTEALITIDAWVNTSQS